ncbi:hypothetical protein NYE47_14100 [Paenibacillus sp. FSL H7-0941]|uniref:hypothetical protein n=1 Tax=Paenibacillus sp. FSL H7-0941 TaxID=2975351 RepID=UPI0030F71B35
MLRWVGGVYCGGRLECGGKLIEEVAGPRGVYFGGRLGAWESLVAEIDGHMEYIAEVAWVRGGSLLLRSMGTWSIFRRSLGV